MAAVKEDMGTKYGPRELMFVGLGSAFVILGLLPASTITPEGAMMNSPYARKYDPIVHQMAVDKVKKDKELAAIAAQEE